MDMKNVKNVSYLQIDHKIVKILKKEGIIILPSSEAWEKFKWTRRYFGREKPKEGYFIWVTKQVNFPISTCVSIESKNVEQNLKNLVVIEKGIKVKGYTLCSALSSKLQAKHFALEKVVLKENSSYNLISTHVWGSKDEVYPSYEFILEKNAILNYKMKSLYPAKKFVSKNVFRLKENAKAISEASIRAKNSFVKIYEITYLNGKNSNGISKLRVVSQANSKVYGYTKMIAKEEAKGHLDCQGLIVDKNSKISLIPALINSNKKAILTHEASIGRISDEELNYLMVRGLKEDEAIELIVRGFLK